MDLSHAVTNLTLHTSHSGSTNTVQHHGRSVVHLPGSDAPVIDVSPKKEENHMAYIHNVINPELEKLKKTELKKLEKIKSTAKNDPAIHNMLHSALRDFKVQTVALRHNQQKIDDALNQLFEKSHHLHHTLEMLTFSVETGHPIVLSEEHKEVKVEYVDEVLIRIEKELSTLINKVAGTAAIPHDVAKKDLSLIITHFKRERELLQRYATKSETFIRSDLTLHFMRQHADKFVDEFASQHAAHTTKKEVEGHWQKILQYLGENFVAKSKTISLDSDAEAIFESTLHNSDLNPTDRKNFQRHLKQLGKRQSGITYDVASVTLWDAVSSRIAYLQAPLKIRVEATFVWIALIIAGICVFVGCLTLCVCAYDAWSGFQNSPRRRLRAQRRLATNQRGNDYPLEDR